jgi:phosphoglycolate phosphatase
LSASQSPIRGVLFDLDGTLVDSRRDIAEAANHALEHAGLARLSHDELASYVGDGAPSLMARAARLDIDDGKTAALVASFLDYYSQHAIDYTVPMPGALEALEALGGYALGVCTNKPRRTTLAVLHGLKLDARFGSVVAGDDLPERKPHPAMVREAARRLGLTAQDVVMVGDGPQDVLAGKAAGAYTVGVHGGMQAFERLAEAAPDLLLTTLSELPAALSQLASGTRR